MECIAFAAMKDALWRVEEHACRASCPLVGAIGETPLVLSAVTAAIAACARTWRPSRCSAASAAASTTCSTKLTAMRQPALHGGHAFG